jgi:cupin 2 domain-containing protein
VWYRNVLGLERRHEAAWGDYPAMVGAGSTSIAFFPSRSERPGLPPGPDALTMRHLAFRASRARFLEAQETLRALGIAFEFQDHAIAHSIYFEDPDGYELEITTYEIERGGESVEILVQEGGVRVERIVSRGHASPEGFWYDQAETERVLLVRGAARLEFEGGRTLEVRPGDWVHIAAHERHRVAWTAPDQETIWIAIFHREGDSA